MALKKSTNEYGSTVRSYNEDDYLSSIEQYRGTEWYDQLLNNPYLTDQNSYQANWFESTFAEGLFNDYSRRENWYNEMARNRDEYKAEILKKIQEAQHNSTAAQAARDVAAGLNPDLTGVSDAGQISAAPQDENPPGAPVPMSPSDILGSAGSVGQMCMNLVQSIGQFGMMYQQFRSAGLDNDLKELQLFDKTTDSTLTADTMNGVFANPQLKSKDGKLYEVTPDGRVIGPDGKEVKGEGSVDMNDPEFFDHILDSLNAVVVEPKSKNKDGLVAANKLFKSQRLRRFVGAVRENYPESSLARRTMREEAKQRILSAHKGQAEAMGDTFYDPDPVKYANNISDWTEKIDKEIRKAEKDIKAALKTTSELEAGYAEEYYAKDDSGNVQVAVSDRNAKVAQNALATVTARIDSIVDEQVDAWSQSLKETNTWWSGALRLVLPQVRNLLKENYISDIMKKFNLGSTEITTTSKAGGVTTSTKQVK